MKKFVTISREYGSGGKDIGKLLAEKLGVKYYDKEIIDNEVEKMGFSRDLIEGAELRAKSSFAYSLASALSFTEGSGGTLSMNDKIFLAQFQVIKNIWENDEEGVVVGRCADYVLRDIPGVTNVFIHAEFEDRVKHAITEYGDDEKKATELVKSYDKARAHYYNYHTGLKWGDPKNYNLSLNSSYISEEQAAFLIREYVKNRTYR